MQNALNFSCEEAALVVQMSLCRSVSYLKKKLSKHEIALDRELEVRLRESLRERLRDIKLEIKSCEKAHGRHEKITVATAAVRLLLEAHSHFYYKQVQTADKFILCVQLLLSLQLVLSCNGLKLKCERYYAWLYEDRDQRIIHI